MQKPKYISNKKLYEKMKEHNEKLKLSDGVDKPKISEYIGESILLICNNLSKKSNFSGYTFKTEMISDGVMDCVAAVDNFDPEKTNNPFAYFTQIAWNAFIRRIHKEKKQTYIKHKNFENLFIINDLWSDEDNLQIKTNEFSSELIKSYENSIKRKS